MKNLLKTGIYSLAALSTSVFAEASDGLAGKTKVLAESILTTANVSAMGTFITIIGTAIVVWKAIGIIFKSDSWADEAKVIFGGILLMIIGTQASKIITAITGITPVA